MKLKGSNVIITGASSGIGRATARRLAGAGSNVTLASRNEKALNELATELQDAPGRVLVVPTDVTDREAVRAMVDATVKKLGGVDVLVNNAGLGLNATVAEGSMENIRYLFEVNVFGAIDCIQAVVPHMKERGRGAIVNISSVAGRIATPYSGAYSATKAALQALSDSMRIEVEPYGIKVSTVSPGYTITGFQENVIQELRQERPSRLVRAASSDDVARTVLRAIRREQRDAYVKPADAAAVTLKGFAPRLIDWGLKRLWLAGGRPESAGER